ncbi:hypothetical protein G6F56_009514 [Rhizopus delemar]|nr:hypothetical protein G6F56_009514 [Rhizopus delemar]
MLNRSSFVIPQELQSEALGELFFNITEALKKYSAVNDVPLNKLGRYVAGITCPELLTSSITRRTKKRKMSTWNAFVAIKKAQKSSPICRNGMKTLALEYKEAISFQRAQLEAQAKQLEQKREGPSFAQDSEARLKKWRENMSLTITDMYNQARIHCIVMYASDGALARTKPATMTNTDVGERFLKAISKKSFNSMAMHYKFNLFVAENEVKEENKAAEKTLVRTRRSANEIEESQAEWKKRIPMEFKAKLELTLGPLENVPWTALTSEKGFLNYRFKDWPFGKKQLKNFTVKDRCKFDEYARSGRLDLVKLVNDEVQ